MAFNPRTINKELDFANLAKHNDNYADIKTELDAHNAHIAAQTAHGSTADATPGAIMQRDSEGRAKVAAPAAADDIARKAEVDAVQEALDDHIDDADVHLSEADRDKLDGIEPGAEPNQNAFAQVNNVVATSESDTLTIAGGTGITISTNPTTKTVTVTATGEATPGPHGSSHDPDGSDPIPELVALRNEFDALTPASIGAETPAGAQAKVDALAGEGNTKTVAEVAEDVAGVTAQLAEKASKRWFDVRDYGAIGDGESDDTSFIQAAINACGIAGGGVVYFPPGDYYTGTVVVKYSGVYLRGSGVGSTRLILRNMTNDACIKIGDYNDLTVRGTLHDIGVFDLEVFGNKANQANGSTTADGTAAGIRTEDVKRITLERLSIHDCDGYGIGVVGSALPNREDLIIRDIETYNNNYDGLDIKEGFTRVLIENVYSHNNGGGSIANRDAVGIDIRGEFVRINNCIAEMNQNHGIRIRTSDEGGSWGAGYYIELSNCISINNMQDGYSIDGETDGQYILNGCYAINNRYGLTKMYGDTILNNCRIFNSVVHNIYIRETGDGTFAMIGGTVKGSANDGIVAQGNKSVIIRGVHIYKNGRRGISCNGTTMLQVEGCKIEGNGTANRDNGVGILIQNVTGSWLISNNKIFDTITDNASKFQRYSVQFSGTSVAGIITSNDLMGSWGASIQGTVPAGSANANNLT